MLWVYVGKILTADLCRLSLTGAAGELLSNLVFEPLNQAATWLSDSTSIPSLNLTPLITLAR